MSDFLGNLASKSLGLAPIIQPRPISLFEPWQTGGALEAAHRNFDAPLINAAAFDRVETGRSTLKPESAATVQARFDPPRREAHDHMDEAPRAAALHPAPSLESMLFNPLLTPQTVLAPIVSQPLWRERDVANGMAAPAPIDRSVTTQTETARASANATPMIERIERVRGEDGRADHDRVERLPAERVIVERERTDRGHTAQSSAAYALAAMPALGAADAKTTARPLVKPIIERVERIQDNSDRGQVDRLSAMRTPQPLTAVSRPAIDAQSAAPPTIQVTIGRIEVRATPPPTPVKRVSSQPAMSLEEYLRSRAGDKR